MHMTLYIQYKISRNISRMVSWLKNPQNLYLFYSKHFQLISFRSGQKCGTRKKIIIIKSISTHPKILYRLHTLIIIILLLFCIHRALHLDYFGHVEMEHMPFIHSTCKWFCVCVFVFTSIWIVCHRKNVINFHEPIWRNFEKLYSFVFRSYALLGN